MKKFMTVLLVVAIMFTFSFGSAFAASYSLDDVSAALVAEKALQETYLANAKTQALNGYTYDENGFVEIGGVKYNKAAVEAAADYVIEKRVEKMNAAIDSALEGEFPVESIDKTVVSQFSVGYLDAAGMTAALERQTATLNKVQAPLTKAYVEAKITVDFTKYDNTKKLYDGLTAVEALEKAVAEAKTDIKEAAALTADADKISGYETALETFENAVKEIKTVEDQELEAGEAVKSVDQAVNAFIAELYDELYPVVAATTAEFPYNATEVAEGAYVKFYKEANAATKAKATLFGVEIADITKMTKAEAIAVNNALYAAIADSAKVVKTYAGSDIDKVTALDADAQTLRNAMDVADKYADVVEYGAKLKGEYYYGIKKYDDAKVDEAVADAEALVYGDLIEDELGTAAAYLAEAADLADLEAVNFEIQKFEAAVEDAKEKFIDYIVVYGEDKTAEADKVFAKELYAVEEKYEAVKNDAIDALNAAESYADIDAAMAEAAAELGKLMLAADEEDVTTAQTAYKLSLASYAELVQSFLDTDKYTDTAFTDAVTAGEELIDEAVTVDAVKAAYEEAKAIVDAVKTEEALKADAAEVVKMIAALPYTAKLTAADVAAVLAANEAYVAYIETPGAVATEVTNRELLADKVEAVLAIEAEAINEAAEDLVEAYEKLGNSDADKAAKMAMKAEIEALVAEANAYAEKYADIYGEDAVNGLSADVEDLTALVEGTGVGSYYEFVYNYAGEALYMAVKNDATKADMEAALEAYNSLTEKQKFEMDADVIKLAEVVAEKLADLFDAKAYVQDLSIKARSVKTAKGNVKVTIVADVEELIENGYTVEYKFYRSTKARANYGKAKKVSEENVYTNTAGVKGTQYFYKAKLVVKNAEGEVVATTPLTQCLYATRTWTK